MKKNAAPIIFCIISVIFTAIWFRSGLMYGGGEEGLPYYNPSKYLSIVSNIWYEANGGYPVILHLPRAPYFWFIGFIAQLGFFPAILQAISFFTLIFIGCLSVAYLTREIITENNFIPLIAGGFYLLNPYSMSQIWSRGIYAQFFAFALIPVFLYCFIRGLKSNRLSYIGIGIILSFILSSAFVVITNVVVLWIPIILYLGYFLIIHRRERNIQIYSIIYTLLLMILWIFTNFWWLWPTYSTASSAYYHFLTGSNNLDSLRGMSQMYFKPIWVIRLFQGFIFFLSNAYNNTYSHLIFRILSWLIPITAVCSLYYLKKIREIWYFLLLWIVGFSFSIGTNPPTGAIFTWFFANFSFLQAFRNPYEKAGLLLMLAYTPLFGLGLSTIFKYSKIIGTLILIVVCGILVWPMWTGRVINAWVKVPAYYKEADNWISSQEGDFKIIQMPLVAGDGVRYDWQHTYQGIEPSEFLFTTSSIGRNVAFNKVYYNILLQRFGIFSPGSFGSDPDTSKSKFKSIELWEELDKLGVRYIVFHRDYDQVTIQSKSLNTIENLAKEKNIKFLKSFGKLDIYEVITPNPISRLYSPNTKLETTKISVDLYKVKIINSTESAVVNLLDLYDPGWELYVDNQKINTHTTAFSYANSWKINKTGNYNAVIKYLPQDSVNSGWKISGIFMMLTGAMALFFSKYESK
ncbi:hypothetical protein HZB69_02180 [Candidatus Amesbacteria bacterium]|nr:hypothetical protein [Candidatus Amesbacteria bacterium]